MKGEKMGSYKCLIKTKGRKNERQKKKNKEQEQQLEKSNQYDRYKSKYINNHFEH